MDPSTCVPPPPPEGLPRTRGDGPQVEPRLGGVERASPHTRGWTVDGLRLRRYRRGFPAHAGMDPACMPSCAGDAWLPRTRGDGPLWRIPNPSDATASPHTRGWTPLVMRDALKSRGFPAHAGMDPPRPAAPGARRRLPRTRGDGPQRRAARLQLAQASPHTRGWTRNRLRGGRRDCREGFPAHAGMDPSAGARDSSRSRLPRTRGDGSRTYHVYLAFVEASPHTRGWTAAVPLLVLQVVGFPAHAGMDPAASASTALRRRLPRTRGDGPTSIMACAASITASPHTRGWTPLAVLLRPRPRGFPAHAGMDPFKSSEPLAKLLGLAAWCSPRFSW